MADCLDSPLFRIFPGDASDVIAENPHSHRRSQLAATDIIRCRRLTGWVIGPPKSNLYLRYGVPLHSEQRGLSSAVLARWLRRTYGAS